MKKSFVSKNDRMPVIRQCAVLGISRSNFYHRPVISQKKCDLINKIDELYTEDPTRGQRRMLSALYHKDGIKVGRKMVRHIMRKLGINAIFPKKHLSIPDKQHPKYPYLLHHVAITRVNQVWSTDITYIRLKGGFVYLTAVIDWYSRCVLSWKLSTTLNAQFCVDAVREALDKYGWPEIFNTDQGCQYTSKDFTAIFENSPTRLSMDGQGRVFDNIFVERLWRTVKYEDVYIRGYQSVKECKAGLGRYFTFYNDRREHSSLDGNTPSDIYFRRAFIEGAA